jgi:hypothetical protein
VHSKCGSGPGSISSKNQSKFKGKVKSKDAGTGTREAIITVIIKFNLLQLTGMVYKSIFETNNCSGDKGSNQGCGLEPDSETLWIRIRIGNPDPDPGARKLKKFQWKKCTF